MFPPLLALAGFVPLSNRAHAFVSHVASSSNPQEEGGHPSLSPRFTDQVRFPTTGSRSHENSIFHSLEHYCNLLDSGGLHCPWSSLSSQLLKNGQLYPPCEHRGLSQPGRKSPSRSKAVPLARTIFESQWTFYVAAA